LGGRDREVDLDRREEQQRAVGHKTRVRSESPGDLRNRCIDYLQDGA
jgi:hypothetical protein